MTKKSFSTAEELDGLSVPSDLLRIELSHETACSAESVLTLERQNVRKRKMQRQT